MISSYLWMASLIIFGACLLYWRKKRKFDRTNEHGIEIFGSYLDKAKADTFDALLLWVGVVCFLGGVFLFVGIDITTLGWLIFALFIGFLLIGRTRNRRK